MGLLLCAAVGLRAAAQGPALGAAPTHCAQDGQKCPDTPTFVQQCQRQGGQVVELQERGSESGAPQRGPREGDPCLQWKPVLAL